MGFENGGIECKSCMDCRQPYAVWFAPNHIWNLVMGGPGAQGDPGGILCPRCFTLRAEAAGVVPTAWIVMPEDEAPASVFLRDALKWIIKLKPSPVPDGFETGPLALLQAAQRHARAALAKTKGQS